MVIGEPVYLNNTETIYGYVWEIFDSAGLVFIDCGSPILVPIKIDAIKEGNIITID
jgi:hypothetical protein